jgi:hypothetical protein
VYLSDPSLAGPTVVSYYGVTGKIVYETKILNILPWGATRFSKPENIQNYLSLPLFTLRKVYDAVGLRYGEPEFFCQRHPRSALAVQPAQILVALAVLVRYRIDAVLVAQLVDRLT